MEATDEGRQEVSCDIHENRKPIDLFLIVLKQNKNCIEFPCIAKAKVKA